MLDQDKLQRIISKNEITDEDFAYIQTHPERGYEYFGEYKLPEAMKNAILCHHERNDGTGYPAGLKKDDIPPFAKIIGTAETFAALISKRAYREKRDIQHALAIISDGARSKFDAEIVDALGKVATSTGSLT
jgi:HD-GYP domain-containing protein (c-di-GMP phosphodiesterase class II)